MQTIAIEDQIFEALQKENPAIADVLKKEQIAETLKNIKFVPPENGMVAKYEQKAEEKEIPQATIWQIIKNFQDIKALAETLANDAGLPEPFNKNVNATTAGLLRAMALKIDPMTYFDNVVYNKRNGKFGMMTKLKLALVERSGIGYIVTECVEAFDIDKGLGKYRATGYRFDKFEKARIYSREFSIADAKRAKLISEDSAWQKYSQRMPEWRCANWVLDFLFADITLGIPGEIDVFETVIESIAEDEEGLHEFSKGSKEKEFIPMPIEDLRKELIKGANNVPDSQLYKLLWFTIYYISGQDRGGEKFREQYNLACGQEDENGNHVPPMELKKARESVPAMRHYLGKAEKAFIAFDAEYRKMVAAENGGKAENREKKETAQNTLGF